METALLKNILETVHDGIYFLDTERRITYWSKGCEEITGFTAAEVLGKSCMDNILMHMDDEGTLLCKERCPALEALEKCCGCQANLFLHHKEGHQVPVTIRVSPMQDSSGKVTGTVEVFTEAYDKIALARQVKELEELALLDQLTGVGNRRYGEQRLAAHCNELRRLGRPHGLILGNLDRFKALNNSHGRAVGDQVLRMVGQTLVLNTRSFDHVARWEADGFMVIVMNVTPETLSAVGEKLRQTVARGRLTAPTGTVTTTISMGGALARKEDSPETLVARAAGLLRESKRSGRDRFTLEEALPPGFM